MQTDATRELRIDLAKHKCFSLRVTTDVTLVEDLARLLDLNPKSRFTNFHEEYTRSGVAHSMTLRFIRHLREQNRYAVRLVYETEEPKEFVPWLASSTTKRKSSEEFLKLRNLEDPFLFRCDCSFSYKREDERVHFLLPIKVDDELFDEVRGLRFVKLQQDKIIWENSIDLIENDLMIHRIRFVREGKFSVDLPQKLLKQARSISRRT